MSKNLETGRLPPGQITTRKFPVVGEKSPPPEALDLESWRLEVGGLVEESLELGFDDFRTLPREDFDVDIHCVTSWSRLGSRFSGVRFATLMGRARPLPEARFARFIAYSERGHDTSLPLELALRDTWLVDRFEGEPLTPEHGGPLRTVTPSRYFYKSLKWVRRIELLAVDRLGYWERESAYHNNADPWPGNERFTTGSLAPEKLERFRNARSYAPYRGPSKVIVGVDLRDWQPEPRELGALELKNCDLRSAKLAGCDLRGANLSLSDLRGADLSGADLRGADLEGANFSGADLRGADLSGSALSAARFFEETDTGQPNAARVEGMKWRDTTGLVESQEAFLREHTRSS